MIPIIRGRWVVLPNGCEAWDERPELVREADLEDAEILALPEPTRAAVLARLGLRVEGGEAVEDDTAAMAAE